VDVDVDLLTKNARAHDDRFYPLFGQLANIAPICAGQTVAYFARRSDSSDDSFGVALQGTTCLILAAGVCLMGLYANIQVSSSVWERGTRALVYLCTDTEFSPHTHTLHSWKCACLFVRAHRMCIQKGVCVCLCILQNAWWGSMPTSRWLLVCEVACVCSTSLRPAGLVWMRLPISGLVVVRGVCADVARCFLGLCVCVRQNVA